MNRAIVATVVSAGIAAGIAAAFVTLNARDEPPALERATYFATPRPLPAFALVDERGKGFGPEKMRGHWSLLFFGFVNCPDVCPMTLATLAVTHRRLADLPAGERPQVVFASVDPRRDTPRLLASYIAHFDPSFTGVTGDEKSIDALARNLGVAVIRGEPDADGAYSVDHSTAVFVIDPAARIVAMFGAPHDAGVLARDFRRIVSASRSRAAA